MSPDRVTINGKSYVVKDELQPWIERKDKAEADRKEYLPQMKVNRCFAAGKQHLDVNTRDGRVVEVRKRNGIELVQANILDQYINTAVGTLAASDYKPNFLSVPLEADALTEDITKHLNLGFGWGWEHEWNGDAKVLALWRYLAIDGTVAVRVRYDRRYGELVGDVPYKNGSPILDKDEQTKYVAEMAEKGQTAQFGTLREGCVRWEFLTMDNLLPPPGYEDPEDFPWDLICRPVSVLEIKNRYGDLADEVIEEEIETSGTLTANYTGKNPTKLSGYAMVYTGYIRPNNQYKQGRATVFTENALLDVREQLDFHDHPKGPRTGINYFRWTVLPGRFWGKAFIENGVGPQKVYNKRLTQLNTIIDRNMPKTYIEEQSLARPRTGEPMEYIEVRPGAPLPKVEQGLEPGAWMMDDLKLQVDNAERAMGLRNVTMGQAPQGVSAYSAMALLTENDAKKLDPVASGVRLGMIEVSWDTMEAMRNWPSNKHVLIAGPSNNVSEQLWEANKIPPQYLVRPPRGGTLPNSQAAEIQKINDIFNAAGGKLPLTWYVNSLSAGKAQELPSSLADQDRHKAELENAIMFHTLQSPPVAPYEDDAMHVESHRAWQSEQQVLADQGDELAVQRVQVAEEHIREHEASAEQTNIQAGGGMGGPMPSPGIQSPGVGQAAPPAAGGQPVPPVGGQ